MVLFGVDVRPLKAEACFVLIVSSICENVLDRHAVKSRIAYGCPLFEVHSIRANARLEEATYDGAARRRS